MRLFGILLLSIAMAENLHIVLLVESAGSSIAFSGGTTSDASNISDE